MSSSTNCSPPSLPSSFLLSSFQGDIITLLKQLDDNWYQGCVGEEEGIVPVSYIQLLENTNQQ